MISAAQLKLYLAHPKAAKWFRRAVIWAIVYVSIFIISSILSWYLNNVIDDTTHQSQTESAQNFRLREEFFKTEKRFAEVVSAKAIWEKVKSSPRSGLKIDKAYTIVEELKKKYYIAKDVGLNIDSPRTEKNILQSQTIAIEASTIQLNIGALNDLYALQFVVDFMKAMPGYFSIKNLKLSRIKEDISSDILNQIINRTYPDIVTLQVELLWRDFYQTKETEEALSAAGGEK